jgi:hypothetical protein
MVVKDPQNPIAIKIEYFGSRLKYMDITTNIPNMKLPITLIIRILIGNTPNSTGDSAILYLRNAPARAPNPNNRNSIPFIIAHHLFSLVGIISIQRCGFGVSKANAIARKRFPICDINHLLIVSITQELTEEAREKYRKSGMTEV